MLVKDLFEGHKLNNDERKLLDYFIFSGTYGTLKNSINNKGGKIQYLLNRVFPSRDFIKKRYPLFYKYKILMPILPFIRIGSAIIKRPKIINELIEVINK